MCCCAAVVFRCCAAVVLLCYFGIVLLYCYAAVWGLSQLALRVVAAFRRRRHRGPDSPGESCSELDCPTVSCNSKGVIRYAVPSLSSAHLAAGGKASQPFAAGRQVSHATRSCCVSSSVHPPSVIYAGAHQRHTPPSDALGASASECAASATISCSVIVGSMLHNQFETKMSRFHRSQRSCDPRS